MGGNTVYAQAGKENEKKCKNLKKGVDKGNGCVYNTSSRREQGTHKES